MPNETHLDLAVIGAGPAGLAAAVKARQLGIKNLLVFERDERPGGILPQCIHNGFGLKNFKEELTGPEYANRYISMAATSRVDIALDTMVLDIDKDRTISVVSSRGGLRKYKCKSIILAMGCRERPRGAIGTPGTRPAGIFTAGQAQRLVNIEGYMPGEEIVIQGSGDVGMIMARRLTLEGAHVAAVTEILPYSSGLIRNEVQCLHDFDIPLLLSHTVSEIHGENRVEGVSVVGVDHAWEPVAGTERFIACDTLLLSVGLIPENELSKMAGIHLDPLTGGPYVNEHLETGVRGLFSCGNVLHVNDLVDDVSAEGEIAARGAYFRIKDKSPDKRKAIRIKGDETIGQIVPQVISGDHTVTIHIRVKRQMQKMVLRIGDLLERKFPYARPSEMIRVRLTRKILAELGDSVKTLSIRCEER